jgi:hypothetical protein
MCHTTFTTTYLPCDLTEERSEKRKQLHNEELCDLYSSSRSRPIRINTSKRLRWVGRAARMGQTILLGNFLYSDPTDFRMHWMENGS